MVFYYQGDKGYFWKTTRGHRPIRVTEKEYNERSGIATKDIKRYPLNQCIKKFK